MKKILISIFSALLLGGISLPASAQAQTGPASNEIWYTATAKLTEIAGTGTTSGLHYEVFTDADGKTLTMESHTWDETTSKGVITFDGGIATVGENAFRLCKVLSSITIPASVTSIGNSAFQSCSALESINIPASVTSIGMQAFSSCPALESISVDANNSVYSSPDGCNAIIEKATNKLIQGCKNTVIPESVEIIGDSAFWMISTLESITIPANVKSIGNSAFYMCCDFMTQTGLTTVTFAKGSKLETIGEQAFNCNLSLSSPITIPASVTSIGNNAFGQCSKLTEVTFAEDSKLETIGEQAFGTCSALSSPITIPASVTSIGDYAFSGCTKLPEVIFAKGSQLGTISVSAFSSCSALSSITIPASVTSIEKSAFSGCSSLTTVIFAEGSQLVTIGEQAFYNCKALSSITIPASVTSIGKRAFDTCYNSKNKTGLAEVTFADGSKLGTIEEKAFYGCSALSSITIPASVTSIENNAFQNCSGIKSVIVNWTEAGKIVPITNAKLQLQEGSTLLVPAGTESLYVDNESWSGFKDYMKPYITANQDPNNKEDYYATFYSSSKAYKLSTEDVTAYTGAMDGSMLKLKPIADGIIPAGEGVVLKLTSTDDTEAKVNFLVEELAEAGTKDTENVLTGTDTAIDSAAEGTKAFSLGEKGVGFYLWTGMPIGAHKAYIPAATQE